MYRYRYNNNKKSSVIEWRFYMHIRIEICRYWVPTIKKNMSTDTRQRETMKSKVLQQKWNESNKKLVDIRLASLLQSFPLNV